MEGRKGEAVIGPGLCCQLARRVKQKPRQGGLPFAPGHGHRPPLHAPAWCQCAHSCGQNGCVTLRACHAHTGEKSTHRAVSSTCMHAQQNAQRMQNACAEHAVSGSTQTREGHAQDEAHRACSASPPSCTAHSSRTRPRSGRARPAQASGWRPRGKHPVSLVLESPRYSARDVSAVCVSLPFGCFGCNMPFLLHVIRASKIVAWSPLHAIFAPLQCLSYLETLHDSVNAQQKLLHCRSARQRPPYLEKH